MSDRAKRAADRIREEIPMVQVLADLGYRVDVRGGDREQQFSCDLHGDGQDRTASARVYKEQFYCWACGRSRDAITLYREKQGLKFWEAVRLLEAQYGLPPLPWEPGEDERAPTLSQLIEDALSPSETAEQAFKRAEVYLLGVCSERTVGPLCAATLWEAFDRASHYLTDGGDAEEARGMAHRVLTSAKAAVRRAVLSFGE